MWYSGVQECDDVSCMYGVCAQASDAPPAQTRIIVLIIVRDWGAIIRVLRFGA